MIFIDEINRGNAARIFGEFMTFLDFDYRDGGTVPLPVPLRQLTYEDGQSEKLLRPGGKATTIPEGFTFPKHVYIVATMNSVDRAAVPIDSALARRFDRIEMRPNLDVLVEHWGMDKTAIPTPTEDNWESSARSRRPICCSIASTSPSLPTSAPSSSSATAFSPPCWPPRRPPTAPRSPSRRRTRGGASPRLGMTSSSPSWRTATPAGPSSSWTFSTSTPHRLPASYAWTLRTAKGGTVESRTLAPVRVSELDIDVIKRSFRWLTR